MEILEAAVMMRYKSCCYIPSQGSRGREEEGGWVGLNIQICFLLLLLSLD